jgi:sodium/bile acid cotransporter 7
MKHHFYKLLWLRLIIGILAFQAMLCYAELTDAGKKEIVYQMYADYKNKDFPAVKDISPQRAMEMMQIRQVVFVDTRKAAEINVSMLPNALTKAEFLQDPLKYKDVTVIGYCTIGYRSGLFVKEMQMKGITVYNLAGGMVAWVLEGGRVFDANGETRRVHVYGKKWNYLPDGYEPLMFGFLEKYF